MIVPDDLTLRAMDRAQFIRTVMWSRLKLGMETTRFEKLSEYNQGLAAQDQVSSWTEWVERDPSVRSSAGVGTGYADKVKR